MNKKINCTADEGCRKGNVEVVKLLLKYGAKVNYLICKWSNNSAKSSSEI